MDRSYTYPRFSSKQELDYAQHLSRSDIRALDEVIELYGQKTFEELKALTHEMPAWSNAWNASERTSKNPIMAFEELFSDDPEAITGASEEMIENFQLRRVFNGRV